MSAHLEQRNQDATCYCGNLDEQVNEELLWELMIQAGPVVNVHMPKDKVTQMHQGYGFVEFRSEIDADYAMKLMNMVKLFNKPIRVNKASQDRKNREIGANLFIGSLDPEVDEKLLYDTFSAFGGILSTPKIMRDVETGNSKGFGFVNYDSFEAADLAIECMNGQFLCNRSITVQYAFKKNSKGERHGSEAERMLAANNPNRFKPNMKFSSGPTSTIPPPRPPPPNMMMPPPPPPPSARPAYGAPSLPANMMHQRPPPPGMGGPRMMMGGMMMRPPPPPMGMQPPMMGMMGMRPPPPPMGFRPPPNFQQQQPPQQQQFGRPPPFGRGPPPPRHGFNQPPRHHQQNFGRPPPPPGGMPPPPRGGPPRPPHPRGMPPPPRGGPPRPPHPRGMPPPPRGSMPPRPRMGMGMPPPPPGGPPHPPGMMPPGMPPPPPGGPPRPPMPPGMPPLPPN